VNVSDIAFIYLEAKNTLVVLKIENMQLAAQIPEELGKAAES
jgi:hypothetical protein